MTNNLADILLDRFAMMAVQAHNHRAEINRLMVAVEAEKALRAEVDRLQAQCNRLSEANEALNRKHREAEPVLTELYEAADQSLSLLKDAEKKERLTKALKRSEKFIDIIPF